MRRKKFDWKIPNNEQTKKDELLTCLELLTRYYKSPCSKKTLTAGLPLEKGLLTPSLFSTAASRADLDSQINQIPLAEITKATLPVVLLLNDGSVALLVDKNEEYARVLLMKTGSGINSVPLNDLEKEYSDVCIMVKPAYKFSKRSQEGISYQQKEWFWLVIKKAWPIYAEVLLASALISFFALAMPLFVMNVYDRVVPNAAVETLWVLASGVFLVFMFDFLLRLLRGYFIDSASKKIDVEISARIFSQILGINLKCRPQSVGAFANIVQSFEVFRDFITSTTITILVDLPFVFLYIFIIYLLGDNLFLIPFLMLPVVVIVGIILQLPLIKLTKKSYQCGAEKQSTLIESLSGIESIKSCGAEGNLQSRWEKVIIMAAKIGNKLRLITNISTNFTLFCQHFVSISVVILGVYKISEGDLTMGALIACTILSGRAIAPMGQLAGLLTRYYQSVNALNAINQVMKLPTDIDANKKYLHRPNIKPSLQVKNVSFYYQDKNREVLKNINFNISAGEKVGILGTIGAGKSTLAKLIIGLYSPTTGNILFGNVEQNQINPADLRYQIGFLPQDPVLFYGTVKENITFGAPYIEDEAILNAAKIAGVDTFISKHPEGYDLQVGERGQFLSQGQRQAIALARSLLLSPKMLVLDEPCASMDVVNERLVCQSLKDSLGSDKTLILVTHKISMLSLVDRIIIIDNAGVAMDGPKDKVLKALTKLKSPSSSEVKS